MPTVKPSDRLRMLEKAGYNSDRIGLVLAKSLVVAESIIDDPEADAFAKMAAISGGFGGHYLAPFACAIAARAFCSALVTAYQTSLSILLACSITRR